MFQISFSKPLRNLFVSKSKAACAQFIRALFLQRIAREHIVGSSNESITVIN